MLCEAIYIASLVSILFNDHLYMQVVSARIIKASVVDGVQCSRFFMLGPFSIIRYAAIPSTTR